MARAFLTRAAFAAGLSVVLLGAPARAQGTKLPSLAVTNHPASDAADLLKALKASPVDQSTVDAIKARYGITTANITQNPFLNSITNFGGTGAPLPPGAPAHSTGPTVRAYSVTSSSIGGFIGGVLSDALQDTLDAAEIQTLSDLFNTYPALQTLFPTVWSKDLQHFSQSAPGNIMQLLSALQGDFKTDFRNGLETLPGALRQLDTQAAYHPQFYVAEVLVTGLGDIKANSGSATLLLDMEKAAEQDPNTNLKPVAACDLPVKLAAFAAHALLATDKPDLVTLNELTAFSQVDREQYYQALVGLALADDEANYHLIAAAKNDATAAGVTLPVFSSSATVQDIQDLLDVVSAIEAALPDLRSGDQSRIASGVSELAQAALAYPPLKGNAEVDDFAKLTNAVSDILPLYQDIKNDKFETALADLVRAVSALSPPNPEQVKANLDKVATMTDQAKADEENTAAQVYYTLSVIAEYATDIQNLLNAKNTSDFESLTATKLIQWSDTGAKTSYPSLWSIDVPVGAQITPKRLVGSLAGTTAQRQAWSAFPVAQIGPEVSWKTSWGWDSWGVSSFSIFVPILDVGALTYSDLRSGSGTSSDSSLSNLVSPGFYLMFGLKFPHTTNALDGILSRLALSVGSQYGPRLEKVDTVTGNTVNKAAWRAPALQLTFDLFDFPFKNQRQPIPTTAH